MFRLLMHIIIKLWELLSYCLLGLLSLILTQRLLSMLECFKRRIPLVEGTSLLMIMIRMGVAVCGTTMKLIVVTECVVGIITIVGAVEGGEGAVLKRGLAEGCLISVVVNLCLH